jgi:hypothetical protein
VFSIVDPNLQLDQLEQVQHQVMAILEHGPDALGQHVAPPTSVPIAEDASTEPGETPGPVETAATETAGEPSPAAQPAVEATTVESSTSGDGESPADRT